MNNQIYNKVEKYIINTFTKIGDSGGIKHFIRTVYWLKYLKPDADEALLIAAISHDIERGFRNRERYDKINNSNKGFRSDEHLKFHQEEGSKLIGEFLQSISVGRKFIDRVKMLVSKHEIGGNDDQNILKDADSLSFFENNIEHFVKTKTKETGIEKVKDKFNWMYERISSEKAREIAKPWYNDALKRLDSFS